MVQPDSEVAKQLKVTGDAHVYKIERARLAGGLPLSVETIYVPTELYPGLLDRHPVFAVANNPYDVVTELGRIRAWHDGQPFVQAVA
ncbi:hypothetical protein MMUR_28900 [Mycolicibacterium murale]|uniref:UbiC transcription regulator-associated domain-containing protein n=1 Tax=Mycolicibacterium murale TaxID=182220 RepID=A0A7I9WM39_9MYCO|nr:UTRA domain-containing protein [Mycolicibacterium murale]GFG58754.1 hypothetical protein MMUR_28900 [Mycolicibacterium murale]